VARRHSAELIPPFPAEIDRHLFGATISGLTDGEGCFYLGVHRHGGKRKWSHPDAAFTISLRADDAEILRLCRSFFGCGYLYHGHCGRTKKRPNPLCRLIIEDNFDNLANRIIPHFERYPLYSKKARDFAIWKEGVAYIHQTTSLPLIPVRRQRGIWQRRWTAGRINHFLAIRDRLRAIRKFIPSEAEPRPPVAPERTLFDDLA
jgi:LAGLIDADG endonuclease